MSDRAFTRSVAVLAVLRIVPALVVFYIVSRVKESPVWLERQRHLRDTKTRDAVSLTLLFRRDIVGTQRASGQRSA